MQKNNITQKNDTSCQYVDLLRAFTLVKLKSYNAILVPPIYQKRLAAVEANL